MTLSHVSQVLKILPVLQHLNFKHPNHHLTSIPKLLFTRYYYKPTLSSPTLSTFHYIPQVKSKSRPRQNFDFVTHHGHFVESWLSIEHHKVIVLHMPFNLYIQTVDHFEQFSNIIVFKITL